MSQRADTVRRRRQQPSFTARRCRQSRRSLAAATPDREPVSRRSRRSPTGVGTARRNRLCCGVRPPRLRRAALWWLADGVDLGRTSPPTRPRRRRAAGGGGGGRGGRRRDSLSPDSAAEEMNQARRMKSRRQSSEDTAGRGRRGSHHGLHRSVIESQTHHCLYSSVTDAPLFLQFIRRHTAASTAQSQTHRCFYSSVTNSQPMYHVLSQTAELSRAYQKFSGSVLSQTAYLTNVAVVLG